MRRDPIELLKHKPRIINIGLEHFYHELRKQGVKVAHVAWRPRPRLEKDLEDILDKIM